MSLWKSQPFLFLIRILSGPLFKVFLEFVTILLLFYILTTRHVGSLTPWLGIEPTPPALEGKVLPSRPPGSPSQPMLTAGTGFFTNPFQAGSCVWPPAGGIRSSPSSWVSIWLHRSDFGFGSFPTGAGFLCKTPRSHGPGYFHLPAPCSPPWDALTSLGTFPGTQQEVSPFSWGSPHSGSWLALSTFWCQGQLPAAPVQSQEEVLVTLRITETWGLPW